MPLYVATREFDASGFSEKFVVNAIYEVPDLPVASLRSAITGGYLRRVNGYVDPATVTPLPPMGKLLPKEDLPPPRTLWEHITDDD